MVALLSLIEEQQGGIDKLQKDMEDRVKDLQSEITDLHHKVQQAHTATEEKIKEVTSLEMQLLSVQMQADSCDIFLRVPFLDPLIVHRSRTILFPYSLKYPVFSQSLI
jgi:TolA-binding protein